MPTASRGCPEQVRALASTLSKFISVYNSANVTVINGPYDALLRQLRAGSLDFLVGLLKNPAPADDVIQEELMRDPYVIAVRKGHPLANKKEVTGADFTGFDWILAPSMASRRIAFENAFPGLSGPHPNVETHSLPTITSILASSDRMAILTQSELEVDRQQGQRLDALNFGPIEPSTAIGVTIRKGLASDLSTTHIPRISARADDAARGRVRQQRPCCHPKHAPMPAVGRVECSETRHSLGRQCGGLRCTHPPYGCSLRIRGATVRSAASRCGFSEELPGAIRRALTDTRHRVVANAVREDLL